MLHLLTQNDEIPEKLKKLNLKENEAKITECADLLIDGDDIIDDGNAAEWPAEARFNNQH